MTDSRPAAPAIPGATRWRKKPIVITAIQFTGTNVSEIWDAFGAAGIYGPTEKNPDHLILTTVHGDEAPARAGDWIIPDAAPDTFYPCKPAVFAATYEPAAGAQGHAGAVLTDGQCDHLQRAEAAEARLLELENAITWGTSCLSCARVLDRAAAETFRAERAEARLRQIRDLVEAGWPGLRPSTRLGSGTAVQRILAITVSEEGAGGGEPRPPVVCLCGSTRFVDAFNHHRKTLTEQGEIVLSIEVVTTQAREDDPQHADPGLKARLDELCKRKIDLADRVLVVSDETGYFGESTAGEIRYAVEHGKPVEFTWPAAAMRAFDAGLIQGAPF